MGKPFIAEIENFTGGLNEAAPENVSANELAVCEDFHVDGPSLSQREGTDDLTSAYTEEILSVFRYAPSFDTEETILLGCQSSIARVVAGAIQAIEILDGVYPSSDFRWWGKQYKDEFFMCRKLNGTVKRLYGPSVRDAGIAAPSSPPTATDGGPGKKTAGVYRFAYRFVNTVTGARSNWSPLSTEVTIAESHQVLMSSILASSNSQVNGRQIGATQPDGAVIYLVGQINDNVSTTFVENALSPDEYGEAAIDVNGVPTTDIGNIPPPQQATALEGHKERLFVLNDDGLSWSEPGLWQSFKASSFIPVNKGNGLLSWDQRGLVISTLEDVEILFGDTPSDWKKDKLSQQHRCASGTSMAVGDGTLFWYTGTNIVASTGGAPSILPRIERIRDTLDSIPDAAKGDAVGVTVPSKGWYLLSVETDDGRKVIVYDYVRSAFAVFPEGPKTLATTNTTEGAEIVYSAFDDDFVLYEYLTGTTDNGSAITGSFRTAKIGGQDSHRITRRVSLHCRAVNRKATVRIYHDDLLVTTRTGVSLNKNEPKRITVDANAPPGSYIQVEVEIEASGTGRPRFERMQIEGVELRRRVMAI